MQSCNWDGKSILQEGYIETQCNGSNLVSFHCKIGPPCLTFLSIVEKGKLVLTKPYARETLFVFLVISPKEVNAMLVKETQQDYRWVYFTNKVLQVLKSRYLKIKKVDLVLVVMARRLRQYFLSHPIIVQTDVSIKQALFQPNLAGRIMK